MEIERLEGVVKACDELIEEMKEEEMPNRWRSKDWLNPYMNKPEQGCWEWQVFERGADAMLEALLNGLKIPIKKDETNALQCCWRIGERAYLEVTPFVDSECFRVNQSGNMVFIPDEEERDADTAE